MHDTLPNVLILIAVAVFIVMLFKKFRLSPVLGYLVAGCIIGEHGLGVMTYAQTSHLAEFGIVFLLFAIGLELSFERLRAMRKYVFGMGSLQVLITSIIFGSIIMIATDNKTAAVIIGWGLALSSTAIVLQILNENRNQSTQIGRISLGILLQQDFAVIPLLAILPILSGNSSSSFAAALGIALLKAILSLLGIFVAGRVFLRPVFAWISSGNVQANNEIFIAATILIALLSSYVTEYMGLSNALGAFIAGILVAETEFRVAAEESIFPFKGLLLGLFFMSVGMTIDIKVIYTQIYSILVYSCALIIIKGLIIAGLCIAFGFSKSVSLQSGLMLAQGSEFAFILFKLAMSNNIIDEQTGRILLLVVTFSMAVTPLLAIIGEEIGKKFDNVTHSPIEAIHFGTKDIANHVIIIGFGLTGRMVGNVLGAENISYIAIDADEILVKEYFNELPVFRGDGTNIDLIKAAGIERALCVITTVNNHITAKKITKNIANNYQNIPIIIKTTDLSHADDLYSLGASMVVPQNYETGLQIAGYVLKTVAGISENEITRIKAVFRSNKYSTQKD